MSRTQQANKEIKPSDVYDLKMKTQQLIQLTRQARTQLSRAQDKINSQTNAINKTFEQQSDTPPVATNHSNTVPQLQRSVESAQNTVDSLTADIEKAKNDDKTFNVRELQEEVKIIYCEYTRLENEINDGQDEAKSLEQARTQAEHKCTQKYHTNLKNQLNELSQQINDLRDKSNAYASKNAKIEADNQLAKEISEQNKQGGANRSGKQNTQQNSQQNGSKTNYDEKKQNLQDEIDSLNQKLDESHQEHVKNIQELRGIIEDMKTKISEQLKNPKPKENEESKENGDDNKEQ